MHISTELARRIGLREGIRNQELEYAGQPFLIEGEVVAAWLKGCGAADGLSEVREAFIEGYWIGVERIQARRPIDPARQRDALAFFARLPSAS